MNSKLKDKLRKKKCTIGSWISIGHPAIAEIFAKAGFEWVVIDLEHTSISIEKAGDLIRVIDLAGCTPLVRLTSNDSNLIKRIMDAGAHGIVVPSVNSVHDAEYAVSSTRYGPEGHRGVGLGRAQSYGASFDEYLAWQKVDPVVIVQIEHKDSLNDLEKIFSVAGVDGYLVGPYDLSCSMGIPGDFDNVNFKKAMKRIMEAGRNSDCPGGMHIVEPDENKLCELITEGYKLIAYSVDQRMLDVSARKVFSVLSDNKLPKS